MSNGYETPTHDTDASYCDIMPDISSVGFGYPGDFQDLMPGYTISAVNVNVNPFVAGTWSTPEAYSWGRSDDLTTNPEIGGEAAPMFGAPFSFGGVESSTVENFEMLGNQAIFQTPDVQNWGDVGYLNFSGVLGSAVSSGNFGEQSYEDISSSIIYGL